MFEKTKAVIFDMDGVVFDSEKNWQKADVAADIKFNTGFDETVRFNCCGRDEKSVRAYLKTLSPSLDVDAYREYIIGYVKSEEAAYGAPLKPGFIELVKKLKARGIPIALATSSRRERAQKLFEKSELNIADIFSAEVYADDVKVAKPNPEIFLIAAQRLGAAPQDTLVIEDSPNGIAAAYAGGFTPVMVIDLIPPSPEFIEKGLAVYNSLTEVVIP
ncbi:MAG: HAD family phosphatase [Clostridiales bacterium]|nr:HAD family phosphatase [Clostridiales bacterium]